MKTVDDTKDGKQPDYPGNTKLAEPNIPGKNCNPQCEEGQTIQKIEYEIPDHLPSRLVDNKAATLSSPVINIHSIALELKQ